MREGYKFAGWCGSQQRRLLPNEYQEVEYIEFHGSEYINTGYIPGRNSSLDLEYLLNEVQDEGCGIFGAREDASHRSFTIFATSPWGIGQDIGSFQVTRICTGDNTGAQVPFRRKLNGVTIADNQTAIADICGRKVISHLQNGDSYITTGSDTVSATPVYGTDFTAPGPAYIGFTNGQNSWGHFKGRVYSCVIKESGETVRDMVPCMIKNTGEYGLYDLISKKFYGDAAGSKTISGSVEIKNITPDTEVTTAADHTVYPIWRPLVTVSFDVNGGDPPEIPDKVVVYEEPYGELPQPTRSGYDFIGWSGSKVPYGYEAVEYLESHGNEYIDLGIITDRNSSLDMEFKVDESKTVKAYLPMGVFGSRTAARENTFSVLVADGYDIAQDIGDYYVTRCCTGKMSDVTMHTRYLNGSEISKDTTAISGAVLQRIKSHLENGNSKITVGDDTVTVTNRFTSDFAYSGNAYLCAINGTDWKKFYGRIYSFKLYERGAAVRDLIPCRKTDSGEYGMYDLISGSFFGNVSGKGAFGGGGKAADEIITSIP